MISFVFALLFACSSDTASTSTSSTVTTEVAPTSTTEVVPTSTTTSTTSSVPSTSGAEVTQITTVPSGEGETDCVDITDDGVDNCARQTSSVTTVTQTPASQTTSATVTTTTGD